MNPCDTWITGTRSAHSVPFCPYNTEVVNQITQMTFIDALIASGYVLDEDNFDDGSYVKTDVDGFIHIYQIGEDEGEWNYVKMTEDYDAITEVTFNPDENSVPFSAN